MKISTKSFKAIEAVLDVAVLGATKPVTLAAVGRHRGISLSYLEQMFRKLREHGLVRSTRGPGGGYRLNRVLADISIADIVVAVDEDTTAKAVPAWGSRGTAFRGSSAHSLWAGLNEHLQGYLRSVTLASLVDAGARKDPKPPRFGVRSGTVRNERRSVTRYATVAGGH